MTGLYIHIPFCQSRCIYCDFVSSTLGKEWQIHYIQSVAREMEERKEESDSCARTIYIGGGTPSQLTPLALEMLFNAVQQHFIFASDTEFTLEVNPDDVSPQFVEMLRKTPVNRVSMGVQSTNNEMLRFLHRRHSAEQALRAIRLLQSAGIENISADLIYGLPGQSLEMFRCDLETLLQTGIPHLSAYALQYEPDTALHRMLQEGKIPPEDEEFSLRCYLELMECTAKAGLEHYEISNFARPGMEARHNSSYWNGLPYLGCGPGAHSFDGETRQLNFPDLQAYIAHPGQPPCETERLSENERFNELILTSLRTKKGLSLAQLEATFGSDARRFVLDTAASHLHSGTLVCEDGVLRLSRAGLFISDTVMSDLMRVD